MSAQDLTDGLLFWEEQRQADTPIVTDLPKFDLESYVNNYEGITRLFRLSTIAHTSPILAKDAFRLAINDAKQGVSLDAYLELTSEYFKLDPEDPLATVDTKWTESTNKKVRAETDRLEHELKQYKNNLIKESIRMAQEDLGTHFMRVGDYDAAFRALSKMREFCTTPGQIAQMTFKLLYVSVLMKNWVIVASYQPKIAALGLAAPEKALYEPILNACVGLAHLQQNNYKDAAKGFLSVNHQYMTPDAQGGITFQKQVMSPNDVAVYGGLCALATMDPEDLNRRVLDNQGFRPLLELEPHLRRAISMFCSSKYKGCLQVLESYMADYLMDYYLQAHFMKLYMMVRRKCIVQWFSAYSRVTLEEIQTQFPSSIKGSNLQQELVDMIKAKDLEARIDLVDNVLVSPNPDSRISSLVSTLDMAKTTEQALRLRLHSINMKAAGFIVKGQGNHSAAGFGQMYDQSSDFYQGAMGLRGQGQGAKFRRGQGGGGGASMV